MKFLKVVTILCLVPFLSIFTSCSLFNNVNLDLPPAAIHVVSTSVTSWDDYVAELQPKFELKPEDALKIAVPETMLTEQMMYEAFRSKLALKLAPSVDMPAGFGKEDKAGQNLPESKLGEKPGPTPPSENSILNREKLTVVDPFLQYWAASSLYQEVKLINRYLKDINYDKSLYKPYIVQFLVNQVPYKGKASFDTHLTMSFFNTPVAQGRDDGGGQLEKLVENIQKTVKPIKSGDKNVGEKIDPRIAGIVDDLKYLEDIVNNKGLYGSNIRKQYEIKYKDLEGKINDVEASVSNKDFLDVVDMLMHYLNPDKVFIDLVNPIVMPMLVADQVEAAVMSRRAERLREMALALAAAYAGIGGQIDLGETSQNIQASLGSQFNSRFTIGRVNDNTVRMIFSAKQTPSREDGDSEEDGEEPGVDYVAEKRNHRVSLLILVPKNIVGENIHFGTRVSFVDPNTGQSLYSSINRRVPSAYLNQLIPNKDAEENTKNNYHPLFNNKRLNALDISFESGGGHCATFDNNDVLSMESMVRNNDYRRFIDFLISKMKPAARSEKKFISLANSLWIDLSEMAIGSQYASGYVFIKEVPQAYFGKANSCVVTDDIKTKIATAIIPGVKHVNPRRISATWSWGCKKNQNKKNTASNGDNTKKCDPKVSLEAKSIALEGNDRLLKLSFDSPLALNTKPDADSTIKLRNYGENEVIKPGGEKTVFYHKSGSQLEDIGLRFKVLQKVVPEGKDSSVVLVVEAEEEKQKYKDYIAKCLKTNIADKKITNCVIMTVENAKISDYSDDSVIKDITYGGLKTKMAHAILGTGVASFKLDQLVGGEKFKLKFDAPAGYEDPDEIEITVKAKGKEAE